MSRLSALNTQLRLLYREIAKFGLVGIAGIGVNLLIFNLLRGTTGIPTVRASLIATVVSIVFNYVGFRYFTYRDREKTHRGKEIGLFAFFSAIGALIENGVLYAATYGMHWDGPLANNFFKFTGIGIATLFRFWSYRTWVFRSLPGRAIEQAEAILTDAGRAARISRPASSHPAHTPAIRRARHRARHARSANRKMAPVGAAVRFRRLRAALAARAALPGQEQREDRRTLLEQLQTAAVGLREVTGDGEAEARWSCGR